MPTQMHKQIEEAVKDFLKEFTYTDEDGNIYFLGGYNSEKNINTDNVPLVLDFIREKMFTIATKSAEVEQTSFLKLLQKNRVKFRFNPGVFDKQYHQKQNSDNKSDYRNALIDDLIKQLKKQLKEQQ